MTSPNRKALRSRLALVVRFLNGLPLTPPPPTPLLLVGRPDEEGTDAVRIEDDESGVVSGSSIQEKEDCASVDRVGIGFGRSWTAFVLVADCLVDSAGGKTGGSGLPTTVFASASGATSWWAVLVSIFSK